MSKRAVLYLRVSTLDQRTSNQEPQLRQVADREQQALNLIRLIASQLGRMPNRLPR